MAYLDSSNVDDLVADIKALADETYALPTDIPTAGNATPLINQGHGSSGVSNNYAREDHVHPVPYGYCSTESNVASKEVSIPEISSLGTGIVVNIYFVYPNTANNPTLNVSNTGAFPIYAYSDVAAGSGNINGWARSSAVSLMYRNNAWIIIGKSGAPYEAMPVAEADAGTAVFDRVITASTLKHTINYFAPPYEHASATTQYGVGSSNNYGHLKLSSATNSSSDTSGGIAATPAAVKAAYDLADGKQDPIVFDATPTKNSSNAVTSGGVYSVMAGRADDTGMITSAMLADVETSFIAANQYSLFSGTSTAGSECGWYGFKHTTSKWASAILFVRNYTYIIKRSTAGVWAAYPLI